MRNKLASILTFLCTSLALSSAVGSVTVADESKPPEGGTPGQNVLITLTVSKTGGTGRGSKTYKMMSQDGSDANMMLGSRTPIPTTSAASGDTGKAPTTNYTYQNEGIQAKLSVRILDKGRILLNGEIEISGVRDSQVGKSDGGVPPTIVTFQQTLSAVVADGKKLRVAEGPDPTGGILSLDVEATTLH